MVSLQTKEDVELSKSIEAEAKKLDAERLKKQKQFIAETLERELKKRDEAIRDSLRSAFQTTAKKRTPEEKALLKKHPSVNNLSAGSLYLYDQQYKTKNAATLKKLAAEVKKIRDTKPEVPYVHAFVELAKDPKAVLATHVFFRGNHESPKDKVNPADLSVLGSLRTVALPEFSERVPTTGRRLAFAESITDGQHPLLARVIVNRIWLHHFGRGLVNTPADFGILGEQPSHPELLDWLSAYLVEQNWSLKSLHRLILNSETWRQQSVGDAKSISLDPDNLLLSHQNPRRLEAELLRDSLLAVTGKLNRKPFGPPVPVMPNEEGGIVIGNDTTDSAGRQTGKFIPLNGEEFRRSIYVAVRRSRPLDMFAAFDAPDMTEDNCEMRPVTTVSPQSLLLMNNSGMREHARYFAEQLNNYGAPGDLNAKVQRSWLLAYGRDATDDEVENSVQFISRQTAYYKENPGKFEKSSGPDEKENAPPELLALGAFCHALISANEFLYID